MSRTPAALLSSLCLVLSVAAFADEGAAPAAVDPRPTGTTVGMGAGWTFPQSILEPNTVGVRVRFGRLALEPMVRIGGNGGGDQTKSTITPPGQAATVNDAQDKNSGLNASIGATVRYPIMSKGPVDLLVTGGLGFGWTNTTSQDDVTNANRKDVTTTSGMSASLSYGLGLEWFIGHGLSVGFDASNPLLTWTQSASRRNLDVTNSAGEVTTTVTDTNRNSTSGALVFAPTLRLMVFLYF